MAFSSHAVSEKCNSLRELDSNHGVVPIPHSITAEQNTFREPDYYEKCKCYLRSFFNDTRLKLVPQK